MLHQILATGYVGYLLISKSTNPYPYAGQAHTYNLSSSSTMDIDISLLAAIGDAMTRGASAAAEQAILPPSTATSPIRASSLTGSPNMQDNFRDENAEVNAATPKSVRPQHHAQSHDSSAPDTSLRKRISPTLPEALLCWMEPKVLALKQQSLVPHFSNPAAS